MRCPALLPGFLLIATGNGEFLSGSFYGAKTCPVVQGWYPVPAFVCQSVRGRRLGKGGKGGGEGGGEEAPKSELPEFSNDITMPQLPEGCLKICAADSCKLYFNRRGAGASAESMSLLDEGGGSDGQGATKKCTGNSGSWNWNTRTCDWYTNPLNSPSCAVDTDANGVKAEEVCPQCGKCQIACTAPKIPAGIQYWNGTNCASGADVEPGTTCTITATSDYFCTSPGRCGQYGDFEATGVCQQKSKCSVLNTTAHPCSSDKYNAGASKNCPKGDDTCDDKNCCEAKGKCSTFNSTLHPCPSGQYNPGSSKDCPEGDDTCNAANCCTDKAKCSTFTKSCGKGTYNPGADKDCPGGEDTCDSDGCCDVKLKCQGNSTTWNFTGRSCHWYANSASAPSCTMDKDYHGLAAEDVCPQCGQCRVQCIVPSVAGVESYSGTNCVAGANVVAGTTCKVNAQSDYFCTSSPGLCGHNGIFESAAICTKKATCTHLNGTCPIGKYNPGAAKNCPKLDDTCDVDSCCEKKATCSDLNGTCPTHQYNLGSDTYCPGDADTCHVAHCCAAKDKCSTFTGTCETGKYNPGAGKDCPGANTTCKESACCDERAKCSTFTGACPTGTYNPQTTQFNPDDVVNKECPGDTSTCDATNCCEALPLSEDVSPVCDRPGPVEATENEAGSKAWMQQPQNAQNLTVFLCAFVLSVGFTTYIIKARRMGRTVSSVPLLG